MTKHVVIIGGGLSGSLLAMRMAKRKDGPEILLLEKNPQMLGRGVAYHQDFTHQPLNVVAAGMSLFKEDPNHFLNWLRSNHFRYQHLLPKVFPKVFVPRKIYGDYLIEQLEQVHNHASKKFQIRIDEALSVEKNDGAFEVTLESGEKTHADHVILALGNFPPADLFPEEHALNNDKRYFSNPWTDKIYSNINGDENILLLGTGLTAVDVVLGLRVRGFKGTITMLSRRGKLPLPHNLREDALKITYPGHLHPREAYAWLKEIITTHKQTPLAAVIDGIRPLTQQFWKSWNGEEKLYFLKRLRSFWEIARHRIPPASALVLEDLVASDQLKTGRGKILSAVASTEGIRVEYSLNDTKKQEVFHKLINCTGPESNYRKIKFPIVANLIAQGKVVTDTLGLGIECTPEGRIVNSEGNVVPGLWCIGPMRKAALWETTALREIRDQAEEIANAITEVDINQTSGVFKNNVSGKATF